ncbi:MAG: TonB-dependent receptor [Prevotellaceae bacterium]|jgi:TonB-linked SusC/RagA family outer membrane protein|nr:TonB-dependent receptor [Prevotellaceae bacterium]
MKKNKIHFTLSSMRRMLCMLALALTTTLAVAQSRQVTGVIQDAQGEAIIGASVVEKGNAGNGTVTNIDGKFSLNLPTNGTIVVSYIGYQTQEVALQGRVVVNVTLKEDTEVLDEVIVVGYGVQKKSDVTGSIASVNADDIKGLATTDAAAALQGKAAGIQILNTSGAPGSGAQIRIRGYSSNSGNLGPLLIVDGLKVDNIQYLDPSMIESMEILKDAASAAIYGAEAGNGVVLITTKTGSGESGRPKVTYSFRAVNQSLGRTPGIFKSSADWIDYKNMSGYDMATEMSNRGIDPNTQTDWIDVMFGSSWQTQHSVTFQDGNDKGHYFTSVNYVSNDGIVRGKKDTYNRLTAQLNADYKLYDWIRVGTNTSIEKWATRSVSGASAYGSALAPALLLDPLTPVYWDSPADFPTDLAGKYATNPELIPVAENGKFYATTKFVNDENGNPLWQRDRSNATNGGISVRGTAFVDLTPIKGLIMTSRFSYRLSSSNSHNYTVPFYINTMAKEDNYSISAGANTGTYYQWENFVNFNKTFAQKHSVGAMAGMSYTENRSDNVSGSASGSNGAKILTGDASNFRYLNYVMASATKSISNSPSLATSLSYFGRLLYTYDNRYSAQVNFRADAFDTSKLPADKRWGKFPSASVGWTVSNEKFFSENISSDVMSFLKLRASWGRNGNINVLNNYAYSAPINYNGAWYQFGDNPSQVFGSYPTTMANPNLTWETSDQLDLGIDMRFFNNRLTASMDYYDKKTKNLLFSYTPAAEIYHMSTTINGGEVSNKGFELELSWRDRIGDLIYSINGNFSTLSNKVTSLYKDLPSPIERIDGAISGTNIKISSAFEEGHSIWYFRGYEYVGVEKETGEALFRKADGSIGKSADMSTDDRVDIGSSIPKYTFGLTLNLMYKGFDFTMFGTGVSGNNIINLLYRSDGTNLRNSLKYYYDNAWSASNKGASMPDPKNIVGDQTFWNSSGAMFSGAYFKIKQIQLGYTIPKALTQKALIKDIRLYVSLDDFFTFTSYPGGDPETATLSNQSGGGGYDIGSYPTMKKITLGASIAF